MSCLEPRYTLGYVLTIIAIGAVFAIFMLSSSDRCQEHGESLIGHSDWGYTLCRDREGTVHQR